MKRCIALLLCLAAGFAMAVRAQDPPATAATVAFDPAVALATIYGGPVWRSAELESFGFAAGEAYVEPLFDRGFTVAGDELHVVIGTLTPQPRSQYACHACSPLIGGGVFRHDGTRWQLQAVGRVIEFSHAWYPSHASFELVEIGPDRHALLHRLRDVSGGYEHRRASLIVPMDGELASRFVIRVPETGESPGPGACGIPEEQHLEVSVDADTDPAAADGWHDLVVDAKYNRADCRQVELDNGERGATWSGEVCRSVQRWRYRAGEYRLEETELEECLPLPEDIVSLAG